MDSIRATPRNRILGLLSDATQGLNDFASKPFGYNNPPANMLMGLLGVPDVAQTLDRMSYGEPLTTGRGMTLRPRDEAVNAALTALPVGATLGKGLLDAGVYAARKATPAIERAVPKILERGGLPAELLQGMAQGTQSPLTVWHGSPHKFDKFDSSKIGTGEGAQAYGHGLYLAESPDVAKSYQTTLTMDRGFNFGDKSGLTREQLQDLVNAREGGKYLDGVTKPSGVADQVIDAIVYGKNGELPRGYKPGSERAALFERLKKEIAHTDQGALYKVDLPDDQIAKMLDWDKPLSQQHPDVQKALAGVENKAASMNYGDMLTSLDVAPHLRDAKDYPFMHPKGSDIYNSFGDAMMVGNSAPGQASASEKLKALGIPGIRYLDGGSRGTGAGTSNFVVFPGNEGLLSILERNGQSLR